MVGDHMGILGAVVFAPFAPFLCPPPFTFPFALPLFAPFPARLRTDGASPPRLGPRAWPPEFWQSPLKPKKRELVVSRFTLLGHFRQHAGKSGPFLLHGG
jgi:hypothetical protein